MSILNYLPTFKIVEINRSTGLVMGHILSQFLGHATGLATNTTAVSGKEFLENGIIVGLNADLTIGNFVKASHSQPFLVYIEELNTLMNGLKYYATEVISGDVYPRAIGLYVGDAFTTDNYAVAGAAAPLYAKVVDGVLTLQDAADADSMFSVELSTTPLGTTAYQFVYLGLNAFATITADIAAHAVLTTGVHGLV